MSGKYQGNESHCKNQPRDVSVLKRHHKFAFSKHVDSVVDASFYMHLCLSLSLHPEAIAVRVKPFGGYNAQLKPSFTCM